MSLISVWVTSASVTLSGVTVCVTLCCVPFFFFVMEDKEVHDVFYFLTEGRRPLSLGGKEKKNKFKTWKKRVGKMVVKKKKADLPLSIENSKFLMERGGKLKIVLRKSDLSETWRKFHKERGHIGVQAMFNTLSRNYYFPKMLPWLRRRKAECRTCKKVEKTPVVPAVAAMLPETPKKAWQLDYIGQFPVDAKTGHRYALVGIDTMSKVVMVSTCYSQSAEHVRESIEEWIQEYGCPTYIYSDNGGPFIHSELEEKLKEKGITLKHGTPGVPRHQGQVERMNATIKSMLTKALLDNMESIIEEGKEFVDVLFTSRNWVQNIQNMAEAYNNTPKSLTGVTPNEVHFPKSVERGSKYFLLDADDERIVNELREVQTEQEIEESHANLQKIVAEKQEKSATKYLAKAQKKLLTKIQRREFQVGDNVLVSYHLNRKRGKKFGKLTYQYSGTVEEVLPSGNYFRIRWTRCPPPGKIEGEVSKKKFRWDQLLLQTGGESEELVLQHYLMVDSYNTTILAGRAKNLEKIWRQRHAQNGELELLCTWKGDDKPLWTKITEVGDSEQYAYFLQNHQYFEELRRQNQEEEEEEERYEVECIFYQRGNEVFVLWANYVEPTWVPVNNVKHLDVYKNWKKSLTPKKLRRRLEEKEEGRHVAEGDEEEDEEDDEKEEEEEEEEEDEEDEEEEEDEMDEEEEDDEVEEGEEVVVEGQAEDEDEDERGEAE